MSNGNPNVSLVSTLDFWVKAFLAELRKIEMASVPEDQAELTVDMEPIGRRAKIKKGKSLLDAARGSASTSCRFAAERARAKAAKSAWKKEAAHPHPNLKPWFSQRMFREGYRLACQAVPETDVKIYIPPESLSAPQRLQIEGREADIEVDPIVSYVDLELPPPSLMDLRADAERVLEALADLGYKNLEIRFPLLETLSDTIRLLNWKARAIIRSNEVILILPTGTRLSGLAVDIGTTKLAGYLVDLDSGDTIAKSGRMEYQITSGEDVISQSLIPRTMKMPEVYFNPALWKRSTGFSMNVFELLG